LEKNKIIIVIPCFNEEKTILNIFKKAKKIGTVVIVNDNSKDKTKKILIKNKINFLDSKYNYGYEYSILKGIKYALKKHKDAKYIATIDADNELPFNSIPTLLKDIHESNSDIIIGKRNKVNRFSESILKLIFLLRFRIHDPISGLKIYKASSLKKIINLISSKYFLVDILVIAFFKKFKFRFKNIIVKKRTDNSRVGSSTMVNIKIFNIILLSLFSFKKF
jgi:glycosyltransferase involved in cell wall biosynthesis